MPLPNDDPLADALRPLGVEVERREAGPIESIVASGLGGIAGNLLASGLGLGIIGRGLASIAGSIAGHLIVTHRLVPPPAPAND
jgi:outer membrane lipoprotein SlyB